MLQREKNFVLHHFKKFSYMTILKKKMEIKNVPFSRLLRQELPELANEVLGIVEQYNPEALQIEEVYNLLQAQQPQIDNLKGRHGASPITEQLKPMRAELMVHVSAIKLQFRLAKLLRTESTNKPLTMVKAAIDLNLNNLRKSKNESILNRKITQFLNEIKVNFELSTALQTLGFDEHITSLQIAHINIRDLLSERQKAISERPREKSDTIANLVVEAIKDLFKQIEVAQLKYPDLDYTSLFDELNAMVTNYRNKISIREANAKRKTAQKKENQTDGENVMQMRTTALKVIEATQPTVPTTMVATTNGALAKDVVNSDETLLNADFAESKDEKKTVASSSKQLQLPASNIEG